MRVWIDVSNSPQVPFFRPLIALLRERGHDVRVTTREYAQTTELLALHGIEHEIVGPRHGGAGTAGKVRAMGRRVRALRRYARGRGFDVALSHASHELPVVARSLGIPSSYAFDYEFARVQHGFGCRAARRVVVPDVIPQDRLDRLGARAAKVRRYPGLKEEYYLQGFKPDRGVLAALGVAGMHVLVVVRTPPDVSLYHRDGNPLFGDVLERLGRDPAVRAVVLPRTAEQRTEIVGRELARRPLPSMQSTRRASSPSGPRRVGRGNDESRGGRARRAGLHHVCGPARRGRYALVEREGYVSHVRGRPPCRERAAPGTSTERDPAVVPRPAAHRTRAVAGMSPTG